MSLTPLEQINNVVSTKQTSKTPTQDALRKAAQQFEAVLLTQLTAALNSTSDSDDEDALFGSDAGSGLSKQMFSEQLATTMANSGGIGLADMMMQKFGVNQPKTASNKMNALTKTISAVRDITENVSEPKNLKNNNSSSLVNKSEKLSTKREEFQGNSDDVEIISTFADEVARGDFDDSLKNLMLDGKILNTTRPRIVPESAIRKIDKTSAETEIPKIKDASPAKISAPATVKSLTAVSYQFPVNGRISSGFGNRFHPIDKKIKFHAGVDIAVPKGTQVKAAAEGEVIFAGRDGGYGNVVMIKHPDGKETRYGHLEKILVSVGDTVSAGQEIAKSGSTGKSTGPHVHFEIRENGEVVNPFKILSNVLPNAADK